MASRLMGIRESVSGRGEMRTASCAQSLHNIGQRSRLCNLKYKCPGDVRPQITDKWRQKKQFNCHVDKQKKIWFNTSDIIVFSREMGAWRKKQRIRTLSVGL
jgi:hypothetical protein